MILFTSLFPAHGTLCLDVAQEFSFQADLVEHSFEQALFAIRQRMEEGQVEAVISSLGTAGLLRRHLPIPVVEIEMTYSDVLRALVNARSVGRRVGVFWYLGAEYEPDFHLLGSLLGLEILPIAYEARDDIIPGLQRARLWGADVVILAAASDQHLARSFGMGSVLYQTSRRAIASAVLRYQHLLKVGRQDAERAAWIRGALQTVDEGLVALDSDGRLIFMNAVAERILGVTEKASKAVPGSPSLLPEPLQRLVEMVPSTEHQKRIPVRLGESLVIASAQPIMVNRRHAGSLIAFQETDRVREMEQSIRNSMQLHREADRSSFENLPGSSAGIQGAIAAARRCAAVENPVLLVGEPGTGKDLFAQCICNASSRSQGPFITVNCNSASDEQIAEELFGTEHRDGSASGLEDRMGLFELAHGGTLYVDEVASLSLNLQARLFAALQARQVMRLGGSRRIPVDFRLIASTSVDLQREVEAGRFHRQLFFYLQTLSVRIPPLRERREDIPLLIKGFVQPLSDVGEFPPLEPAQLEHLMGYDWPGNVRELEGFVLRRIVLGGEGADASVDPWDAGKLRFDRSAALDRQAGLVTLKLGSMREMEMALITAALDYCNNSVAEAARLLEVSRVTLWRRLRSQTRP